jgi:predicted transcriptional regulator
MPAVTKSTFSLDATTVERLNRLARRWQVSKTEVLRRAVAGASEAVDATVAQRVAALDQLECWVEEQKIDTDKWLETIKDGRR